MMAPLAASRIVEDWNWPARSFLLVYVVFFTAGMIFPLIARKMGVWSLP
ncbi:MAG: hypothetical protein JNK48_10240 [Bryobacterales bacterium]|nr:hypothetical protein [Bryobacterales bacterium]